MTFICAYMGRPDECPEWMLTYPDGPPPEDGDG